MLDSLLMKMVAKAAAEHPIIISDHCINKTQKYFSCTVCADQCREDVFTDREPRFDRCINCNLCSAVCPAQAILPSAALTQQIISIIETQERQVYVYCHKREGLGDINIHCLASLPWEIYTALALDKKMIISLLPCEQCTYATDAVSVLARVKEAMGEEFFQERFILSHHNTAEKILSRREIFSILRKKGQRVADYIISDPNVLNTGDSLFYRRYLLKKLNSVQADQPGCCWRTLDFNKNCWSCGLCASVCPNKAITMVEQENRELILVHVPWRCTQCGLCIEYCPENAINGWRTLKANSAVQQEIIPDIEVKYCPKCHKAMKPVDNGFFFCYYCGNKEKPYNDSVLE